MSPNGRNVAFLASAPGVDDSDIYMVDTAGARTVHVSEDALAGGITEPHEWSPNGTHFVLEQDGRYFVVDPDGSNRNEIPSGEVIWAPDESHFAYATETGAVIARQDGTHPQNIDEGAGTVAVEGWSSLGTWLMTTTLLGGLSADALQEGTGVRWGIQDEVPKQHPLWSPTTDGSVAYVNADGTAQIALVPSSGDTETSIEATGVKRIQWSPDGTHLALSGDEFWVVPLPTLAKSVPPIRISGTLASGAAPRFEWSPDGQHVAYAAAQNRADAEEVFVADVSGKDVRKVSGAAVTGSTVSSLLWSPDGRFLSFKADHRKKDTAELSITEVATGRRITIGQVGQGPAWSFDGRFVAFQLSSGPSLQVLDTDTYDATKAADILPSNTSVPHFAFGTKDVE